MQSLIKIRDRFRISVDVPAMPVKHIVVYEVHKHESGKIAVHPFHGFIDPFFISGSIGKFRHAASGKDIVDLTDGKHIKSGAADQIQHRIARRHQGKIMTV